MVHPDGRRLSTVLASGAYDYVVIAESIDLVVFRPPYPARFREDGTRIALAARAGGAVPIFYATPYVEAPDTSGFHGMADPQIALGRELGVSVARGGLAWLRVWAERPAMDLYDPDRAHPGYRGSYTSACTIVSAITGGSPIGLAYRMSIPCHSTFCPPITADEAAVLQGAAWAEHLAP
jgi:hypothetical protein